MKKKAIIVDLDGTLCNNEHRLHLIVRKNGEVKDWTAFKAAILGDSVNLWCKEIVNSFIEKGYQIIFLTGRMDMGNAREDTLEWLHDNGTLWRNTDLIMRPSGDKRQDDIIKKEQYLELIEPNYDVLFALDDRKRIAEMWRSIGITCLHCAEGNF